MSAFLRDFPLIQQELDRVQEDERTETPKLSDGIARLLDCSSASSAAPAPPRPEFCRLLIRYTCSQLAGNRKVRRNTEKTNQKNHGVLRLVVFVLDMYLHSNGNVDHVKESVSDLLESWCFAAVKTKGPPFPLSIVLQMPSLRSRVNVIRVLLDCSPLELDIINRPSGPNRERPLHHLVKSDLPLTEKKLLVHLLVDRGVHIDAVDKNGKDATQAFFPLSLKSPLHDDINHIHDMVCLLTHDNPPPLCCLAAKAVISGTLPYRHMLLPPRLKQIISYHDPGGF